MLRPIVTVILIVTVHIAHGGERELNPDILLKQQQILLERQINQQEIQKRIENSPSTLEIQQSESNEVLIQNQQQCFKLTEISFINAKLLSKREQDKLTKPFVGKCITLDTIQHIMRQTTNYYTKRGYITSRAFINPQDITTGKLEVVIVEGKIDEIEFEGQNNQLPNQFPIGIHKGAIDGFLSQTQIISAFGGIKERRLNIKDIERGLEQLNRLSSNNATMQIVPSQQEEYSKIIISKNIKDKTTRLRLGLNNAGQQQTGMYNGKVIFEQENLAKINDSIMVVFTHDIDGDYSSKKSQNIYANINIPFGKWNVSTALVESSYLSTINGTNTTFKVSGKSSIQTYKLERKIFRNAKNRISVFSSMNLKNTQSFIEDALNDVGSRRLSVLSTGFNHNIISKLGYFDYTLARLQGLNNFGAKSDSAITNDFTPMAQYEKYIIDINYYKNFNIGNQKFFVTSNINGQYSQNPLFASEQIIIGDQYSVRGFRAKSALGDDGMFIQNNINYTMPAFLTDKLNINSVIKKTEIFAGYDYGYVRQKGGTTASFGQGKAILSGVAIGTRFKGKIAQFDITYAHTLNTEDFIPSGWEIYGNLTVRLW